MIQNVLLISSTDMKPNIETFNSAPNQASNYWRGIEGKLSLKHISLAAKVF